MSAEELEQYQYQLSQITLALHKDPFNKDLLQLKHDLSQVIQLTQDSLNLHQQTNNTANTNSLLTPLFQVGEDVIAKYAPNKKLYKGTVTSIKTLGASSTDDIQYMVIFDGYRDSEPVLGTDIYHHTQTHLLEQQQALKEAVLVKKQSSYIKPTNKPITPSALGPALTVSSSLGTRKSQLKSSTTSSYSVLTPSQQSQPTTTTTTNTSKLASKRAVKEKQAESEHKLRQLSWQQFASTTSNTKKTRNRSSIFATPDNPFAKVGVTGSGRGMTEVKDRTRHKFNPY